jgi:hypothetical protein
MKTIIITSIITLLFMTVKAQSNCSKYYPFNEGRVSEYEMLNKKGKIDGLMIYKVVHVNNSESGATATIKSELFDKKGKALVSSTFDMSCDGTKVIMDYKSLMSPDMLKTFNNMEPTVTGINVDLPNDLSVGQSLPDAGIQIKMNMGGMDMNMSTDITNRKAVGTETITTPAGTFDCIVITQSSSGKMMMAKFKSTQKTWIAEGVGMVKSEHYNNKGKLAGSTVLTSFSK